MENKEPSGEGTAKQKAAGEEYKQEAEEILKLHRQDKVFAPSAFRGVLNVYLLFIAAVTGVGMLASYTHHETTANVFLLVSIALLLLGLISALWYVLVVYFRKKPLEKVAPKIENLAEKIARSRAGMALIRFTNNRFAKLLLYFLYIVNIGFSIGLFSHAPRFSLTFISFSILILVSMATSEVAAVRKKEHEKDTIMLAKAVVGLYDLLKLQDGMNTAIVESMATQFDGVVKALKAIHNTTEVIANPPQPEQLDAESTDDVETGHS